jgi:uncharacterized membrane protein YqjE
MSDVTARTIPEIFNDIVRNVDDIVQTEVQLIKAEIKDEANQAARASMSLAVGICIALYGGGFLLLALVYALAQTMQPWLAALLVGAFLAILSWIFVGLGLKKLRQVPKLEKTTESLKENVQWAKDLSN